MNHRLRKLFFWVHLVAGLGAALFFLVMSGTGVALAFRPQLEKTLNHWRLASNPPGPDARALPIEILAQGVRETTGATPQAITVSSDARETVDVDLGRREGTVYVDAYTGAVLGRPSPAVFGFFAGLMDWHTALGIKGRSRLGHSLIGAANLISFVVIVVGLYLWLPRKWTWSHVKAVLLFRPGLTGKARDFNWHNVIGIWTLVPLTVLVWSGVALSYRWAGQATVQALALVQPSPSAGPPSPPPGSDASDTEPDPFRARVAGLGSLLERAKSRVPGWRSIEFSIPESMDTPVSFTLDPTGYGLTKGGDASRLQLARSGEELGFQGPRPIRGRGVYRFAHTGELWGPWGQTAALLGSLGGVILVWTGTSLSIRRFWPSVRRAFSQRTFHQGPAT